VRETLAHRQAFQEYKNLGKNRSYDQLAKLLPQSKPTLARWGQEFDWPGRIKQARNPQVDAIVGSKVRYSDNDIIIETEKLMGRTKQVLDDTFKMVDGQLVPTFTVKTVADFVKLVGIQKDLIMLRKELERGDYGKKSGTTKLADNVTIYMEGATDEQKLALLTGNSGAVGGGDTDSAKPIQEADFEEVPGESDQETDRPTIVPGSVESSKGGD